MKKQSLFTTELVERNGEKKKVYTVRLGSKAIIQLRLTYND